MSKTIEQLAKEHGITPHPIHGGLIVRHSNGSWIDISSQLEAMCKAYHAQECEGWISVEDKLPVEEQPYLVFGNCTNDGYKCDIAYFMHGNFEKYIQPTHWQPLPSAPTKGE